MHKAKISADTISIFTKELMIIQNRIQKCLKKEGLFKQKLFTTWKKKYSQIYGNEVVKIDFYSRLAILYHFGYTLLFRFLIMNSDNIREVPTSDEYDFVEIQDAINNQISQYNCFRIGYFEFLNQLLEKEIMNDLIRIEFKIIEILEKYAIPKEYMTDFLIQELIPDEIKHQTGEYYTPPFLTKMMIKYSYSFGEMVLDPCCGSGNFLIETINTILESNHGKNGKIEALNNIYGFDINPLSTFMTNISLLLILDGNFNQLNINIYERDSLFQKIDSMEERFDLVIGNPPWYTLRDVNSSENQQKIKSLAQELNIKPLPKNVLNIEISSIFFYQMKNKFLKEGGKIFFILPKGVINGSHAARFRNFNGFENLKIWEFDDNLKRTFNIDFICLYAQKKSKKRNADEEISIPLLIYGKEDGVIPKYFHTFDLKIIDKTILIPFDRIKRGNKIYIKKLITKQEHKSLINPNDSYYKEKFHKGADLNPRTLIFVNCQEINETLVKINPDPRVFKRAKKPWNRVEYENAIVEKRYIHKVVKSTELVKFYMYNDYRVFLPINEEDLHFSFNRLSEKANKFYTKINQTYLSKKKTTTKNKSLMDNLNRWNKLSNSRQLSDIKVVYNNSGTILNAAVLQNRKLVTGDLSFLATENLDEAYYLSAILNSPIITKQIKIMKSSRHIFKLPLNLPIQKFNPLDKNHTKLSSLGLKGEQKSKELSKEILSARKNSSVSPKYQIQKILEKNLTDIFHEIDVLVEAELNN